jgi:putative methyltransferase (TIGR04325 family)
MTFKSLIKSWLPPAVLRAVRSLSSGGILFEGDYATWEEAAAQCTGYDAEHILAKVLEATLKVKRGEAAYERDSVLFDEVHYAWPVTAGLMWAAATHDGRLNVLDFGGSLGSSYFQHRQFLGGLQDVRWSIVEQEHFVNAGKQYVQHEQLRFYQSVDECVKTEKPNVVLLSSVLQYLENPYEILERLSEIGAMLLIIDRSPFWPQNTDGLMIQHVPPKIYPASYPTHIFSEPGFRARMKKRWPSNVEFLSPEGYVDSRAGRFVFKGFLLTRES